MAFNWECPHCNKSQSVVDDNFDLSLDPIPFTNGADERLGVKTRAYLCANTDCQRTTVEISLVRTAYAQQRGNYVVDSVEPLFSERVLPRGAARPQPPYIPQVIVNDYVEACLIKELSPKASATLSRRCLQGMVRGFAGISKGSLIEEIKALKTAVHDGLAPRAVTIESVDAIDHVRKIGNIGAHMEKDINVIVDVDPEEAGILIQLIEELFGEWYIAQHNREERFSRVTALGETKTQQLIDARAQGSSSPPDPAQ